MESVLRIIVVTFVFLVWIAMGLGPARVAFAHDDDDHAPKPTLPANTSQQTEPDRHKENFWGGVAFGGLAVTAFQKTEHPTLYAIGTGIATAAAVQAAQSDGFNNKNFKYAVGGVILGATGTGFVFGKQFFGWQTAIRW